MCGYLRLTQDFSLPCPAEEASDRAAFVGTWHPARVTPPHLQRGNLRIIPVVTAVTLLKLMSLWEE